MLHVARALVWLLPNSSVKKTLLRMLGHAVHRRAIVGPNLVWRCNGVTVERDALLGAGNVFSGLKRLHLGHAASIGHWNWMSSAGGYVSDEPFGCLNLGSGTAVTSRHYIDATGGVTIGAMTTFAGHRSTILTHGIDVATSQQVARPVIIGAYCLIGSDCKLVPGAEVNDRCMIAMGSVLTPGGTTQYSLWGGSPAKLIKALPEDALYWSRARPSVEITVSQRATEL